MYYKEYAPNKSIDTKIYKDFFTQEELSRINECINKQKQLNTVPETIKTNN
jgi:hypothetical protein